MLLECSLGAAAVCELHKATSLANGNLHVDEFTVGLEMPASVSTREGISIMKTKGDLRLQVLLVDRGVEVANEHCGVVRVG